MNGIIGLGKYLFADMASMAPGGVIMVYATGAAFVAAAVSIFIGKLDKLAAVLLALMLLLFIIPHAQNMANDEAEMFNILKNIALAGGALMYASMAKDDGVIG